MIRGKNQYKVHAFEKLNCINQVIHYESVFYYHIEFMDSDIAVSISFSFTPTAGDLLNLTCSATVPERLVERHRPGIVISYDNLGQDVVAEDNSDAIQSNVTRVDNVFLRIFTVICNCEVISVKLALVPHLMQNLMRTENSQCIVTLCLKTINLLYAFNFLL